MIAQERLMTVTREEIGEVARSLDRHQIALLVEWLASKDDKRRYQALLLLQHRSMIDSDVSVHWSTFQGKLKHENSYQRSIGIIMIAENVQWDMEGRMEKSLDDCLSLLGDKRPITVRQCIQALTKIAHYNAALRTRIAAALEELDLLRIKESMRGSVLRDLKALRSVLDERSPSPPLSLSEPPANTD